MIPESKPPQTSRNDGLSWLGDDEFEQITALKLLLMGAVVVGPVIVLTLWRSTMVWLLDIGVLVPASQALVTIPSWEAGLDLQRLIVAFFLLCSGLSLLVHLPSAEERAA